MLSETAFRSGTVMQRQAMRATIACIAISPFGLVVSAVTVLTSQLFGGALESNGPTRRERIVASMARLHGHEERLRVRIERGLAELPGVVIRSRAARRTPTLLVTFDGRNADDAYTFLAGRGVNAPAGSFYALEASRWMGLGDDGGLRVGLAPYTDDSDVDRLLEGLAAFLHEG